MKKSDIQVGAEYAVNPRNYARQGQAAGDRGLVRGVIHSYVEGRYGRPGSWLVTLPEGFAYYDGKMKHVGETVTISSRNVVAPWDEHTAARAARDENERLNKIAAEKAAAALKAKIERLREELPEGLQPRWISGNYPTASGHISVDHLLSIIAHVKEASK